MKIKNFNYAYAKLSESVEHFMIGKGNDKDKIKDIYIFYLDYLTSENVPETCKEKLSFIRETLTDTKIQQEHDPNNRQGTVYWNVSYLHYTKVRKIKRYVWEMYKEIDSLYR